MGFEGKPNDIKKTIIEASAGSEDARERLSKAGRKGAMARAENIFKQKVISNQNRVDLIQEIFEEMKQNGYTNTEGEIEHLSDEKLIEKAEELADAVMIARIGKKMKNLEQGGSSK